MHRHEQWSVGELPTLDLRVPGGSIEVSVGDAGVVQVSLEAPNADDYQLTRAGDRISVFHPSRWLLRSRNCRVVATVPRGTDVVVDSASADVRLIGQLGAVRVRTASGDVDIDTAASVEVNSASGDVGCHRVDGDVDVTTVSGDMSVRHVGGRLDATLTSGDLRVERCDGDLLASSVSGSLRIGHCGGGEVSLRSISGDLRIGLPSGIRVDADISTVSGKASLPTPANRPATEERRLVRLRLKSVSGDVRVDRND